MPKTKGRHPIQTIDIKDYPSFLKHCFEEGDVVVINPGKGHEIRLLKDIIKATRKIWRQINADNGIFKKTRFTEKTRDGIWREYNLIISSEGVVIGRSPIWGQSIGSIANVCYLVGGSGFGGLSFEYDVCFVEYDIDLDRHVENKVCIIWTFWSGALIKA